MGLSKPIIIQDSSIDISNLATKSDIDSIKNSVGAVKSVQRGVFNNTGKAKNTITISSVNVSKSFVNIAPYMVTSNNMDNTGNIIAVGYLEGSNTLSITGGDYGSNRWVLWEVIEFK